MSSRYWRIRDLENRSIYSLGSRDHSLTRFYLVLVVFSSFSVIAVTLLLFLIILHVNTCSRSYGTRCQALARSIVSLVYWQLIVCCIFQSLIFWTVLHSISVLHVLKGNNIIAHRRICLNQYFPLHLVFFLCFNVSWLQISWFEGLNIWNY